MSMKKFRAIVRKDGKILYNIPGIEASTREQVRIQVNDYLLRELRVEIKEEKFDEDKKKGQSVPVSALLRPKK